MRKGSRVRDGHDKGRLIEAPVHEAERQDEASSVRFLQILHHSLIELPPIRQGVPYTPLAAVLGVVASEQQNRYPFLDPIYASWSVLRYSSKWYQYSRIYVISVSQY